MRFVRALTGMLLLVVGIPALLVGLGLWAVDRQAGPDGAFGARVEPVRTTGRAVVVDDVDALLRDAAPMARAGRAGLRLTADTADGPAFLGLAPAGQVRGWLAGVPHAGVERVAPARGPLPVRLGATTGPSTTVPAVPLDQHFWVREGIGSIQWSPAELSGRGLSLVVMRPDGAADLALDARAELRVGWLGPAAWALLVAGVLLIGLAALVLLRPVRPREVVFVVEPDQVPVLAGRLGVSSLSGLGTPTAQRQLVSVGAPTEPARPAIGAGSSERPATLADLPPWPPERPDDATR